MLENRNKARISLERGFPNRCPIPTSCFQTDPLLRKLDSGMKTNEAIINEGITRSFDCVTNAGFDVLGKAVPFHGGWHVEYILKRTARWYRHFISRPTNVEWIELYNDLGGRGAYAPLESIRSMALLGEIQTKAALR